MARTVYLHVGTAKSGTTYLQRRMAHNRALLRRHGYLYPGDRGSHFLASLDLRETGFKGHRYEAAEGAWRRIAEEVRHFPGDALVSHETLAHARAQAAREAVDSLGSDVRVLITCRDLGRQVPAVWQENVKNWNQQSYSDFLAKVFSNLGDPTAREIAFWRAQDVSGLAARWAEVVGPDKVVLVTVPRSGAAPGELWRRFVEAAGLPALDYEEASTGRNPSLGTVETELLRRLNGYLADDIPWPQYEKLVKHRLVELDLSPHELGGRFTVPEEFQQQTREIAIQMIGDLREAGYQVVGSLDELNPEFRPSATRPQDVTDQQLLDLALRVIAGMALRRPGGRGPRPASGRDRVRAVLDRLRRRFG
jgi:hypothetical protein